MGSLERSYSFKLVQTHSKLFKLVQTHSNLFKLVQVPGCSIYYKIFLISGSLVPKLRRYFVQLTFEILIFQLCQAKKIKDRMWAEPGVFIDGCSRLRAACTAASSAQTQSLIFLCKMIEILHHGLNKKCFEQISQIHDILILQRDT